MAAVVHTAMESYAFGRGQRERVRVMQAEDFHVRGDENLLIYVLFNLLQNALVFDAGRPDLVLEVRFGRDGDGGWLSVRDNGPGIPPERLPGIFESFMTYANKQGTGLGLPFCKRVMTALGGGIDVRSAPGEGTEFLLRFPPVTVSAPVSAADAVPSRA
jgi:signal transduction histidine kinase